MPTHLYTVFYPDVHRPCGFEVNDRSRAGEVTLTFSEGATPDQEDAEDAAILSALQEGGFLSSFVTLEELNIGGDIDSLFIDREKDGLPLFQLERQK